MSEIRPRSFIPNLAWQNPHQMRMHVEIRPRTYCARLYQSLHAAIDVVVVPLANQCDKKCLWRDTINNTILTNIGSTVFVVIAQLGTIRRMWIFGESINLPRDLLSVFCREPAEKLMRFAGKVNRQH